MVVSGASGRIGRTMKILPESVGLCSTCGRPLNVNSECLPCLVRIAFDEPAEAATAPPALLVFGDFEVEQRPDGFYWELGHGAMGVTYLAMDKGVASEGGPESDRGARDRAQLTSDARTLFA